VRSDLTPGQQLAQAVHAAFRFAHDWPETTHDWVEDSNFLVIVAAPDIGPIVARCNEEGIPYSLAVEPDMDNLWTAIALEPGADARRLCANYPLALKRVCRTDGTPKPRVYTDADAEAWVMT
jgi:hypothetical protein